MQFECVVPFQPSVKQLRFMAPFSQNCKKNIFKSLQVWVFCNSNVSLQVRKDHVGPIYVINLLISDLIQYCCLILLMTGSDHMMLLFVFYIYCSSLNVRVGFMVCIALER